MMNDGALLKQKRSSVNFLTCDTLKKVNSDTIRKCLPVHRDFAVEAGFQKKAFFSTSKHPLWSKSGMLNVWVKVHFSQLTHIVSA